MKEDILHSAINTDQIKLALPDKDDFIEGDWNDEDDDDFQDNMEVEDDLTEIREEEDIMNPEEDDDHLPDDDLQ